MATIYTIGRFGYYTLKYYSDLDEQITPIRYNSTSKMDDIPVSLKITTKTNPEIYITGYNALGNINTVKFDSAGNRSWEVPYDCGNNGNDVVSHMVLDKYESIYLTGYSDCEGNDRDVNTIKYCTTDPNAIISANGSNTICNGGSLKLSVSQCTRCKYHWSTNDTTTSITVSPTVNTSYIVTVSDAKGCDGISQPFDVNIQNVDTSISLNNGVLTANANNATYQWLDCDDSLKGMYFVVIHLNNFTRLFLGPKA